MRIATQITAVALVMASVSGAWASATLESTATGVVSRVSGRNAHLAVGANLETGMRIVVGRAGRGDTVLRYEDGCEVRLRPGQVYTIAEIAPCGVAAPAQPVAPTAGLVGGVAPIVVGGVVLGAVVAGVVAATSGKGAGRQAYLPISP